MPDAPQPPPTKPARRRVPWAARVAGSWSALLLAADALRVAAATAELAPATLLGEGVLGVGLLATVGLGLALIGLTVSLVGWPIVGWRSLRPVPGLAVLALLHAVVLAVFPARWLLGWLQTDEVLFSLSTERPVFALTIDDGLDPATTPLLLRTLREHSARATFFVLGQSLEDHPGLAQRCLDDGHELANHQMTDTPAITLLPADLADQVGRCDALLRGFIEPRWFRPGGGIVPADGERLAARHGYTIALGSVFPFDTHLRHDRFLAAYVAGRTTAGDIVVLHDGPDRGARTAAVLDKALAELTSRGLTAVTLSDLRQAAGDAQQAGDD